MFFHRLLKLCVLFMLCLVLGCAVHASAAGMSAQEFRSLCSNGTPEEIERAIRDGADVNSTFGTGEPTPLISVAMMNSRPKVISILLNAGADVNAKDKDGMTALMWSALGVLPGSAQAEIVSLLLNAGADVNVQDEKDGRTALMFAAMLNSDPRVIPLLLEAGADTAIRDKEGLRAIDFAENNETSKGKRNYKILKEASEATYGTK